MTALDLRFSESALNSNAGLVEFLLSFMLYAPNSKEAETHVVRDAFNSVVSIGRLPDGENEIYALPELLHAQPGALGASLSRILRRQPDDGAFKVYALRLNNSIGSH